MTTIKRYTRDEKNQEKINAMTAALAQKIAVWLEGQPTGQIVLSIEMNAKEGGIGMLFMESKERDRI